MTGPLLRRPTWPVTLTERAKRVGWYIHSSGWLARPLRASDELWAFDKVFDGVIFVQDAIAACGFDKRGVNVRTGGPSVEVKIRSYDLG